MIQRNLQAQVITVQTDRGTEFLNKTLHAYFKEEGIEHQTYTPQTPEQNSVVKRRNCTLVEAARTMLSASKLPLFFWAEATAAAFFVVMSRLLGPGAVPVCTTLSNRKNQASGARVINAVGNTGANQPRVIRCYNCKGEGRMDKQCIVRKRVKDSEYLEETNKCEDLQLQATTNFKADQVDAYDSDYDDEATTNAIFMANLSPIGSLNDDTVAPCYDSNTLSKVPHYDTYHDSDMLNSNIQELGYIENIVSTNESYDELKGTTGIKLYLVTPFPKSKVIPNVVEKNDLSKSVTSHLNTKKIIEKCTKVLALGLLKIESEPINAYFKNNRDVHRDYLKVTKEHVATLQELLEQARALKPLDKHIVHTPRNTVLYAVLTLLNMAYLDGKDIYEIIEREYSSIPIPSPRDINNPDELSKTKEFTVVRYSMGSSKNSSLNRRDFSFYQPGGQYRAARPGFYQQNNGNSSYPDRRPSVEESLTKFVVESAKRLEENLNIIKEIRASTDAAIRNQGASIKTLEIQIGQMSKVLQERGFGSLPSSTETNPRDQVKSISTAKADFYEIRRIGSDQHVVSVPQHKSICSEIVPFHRRLQNYGCDN
ncbi:reverse transcriptase domain-containing protein [Tanacetum coccineum]